jgi:uncharacterized protein YndB with AHSA1/START domain
MQEFEYRLAIHAPPAAVLDAFFDAEALAAWWRASRAVCIPRPLGGFAVEWETTTWRDEVLGPLGGTLYGTVMEYKPGREFFIADLYWLPPEGNPIGPMALEALCRQEGDETLLHVRHSGGDATSERWTRYFDVMSGRWVRALHELKNYLEERWV